jgi:hypothetical protein
LNWNTGNNYKYYQIMHTNTIGVKSYQEIVTFHCEIGVIKINFSEEIPILGEKNIFTIFSSFQLIIPETTN